MGGIISFEFEDPLVVTLWLFSLYLIVASLIKLGYVQSHFLTSSIPESCLLITIGISFGAIIKIFDIQEHMPKFTVDLFFFGLMPPIMFEAARELHNENFFNNVFTIIMYAGLGTLINLSLIGISLYLCSIFQISSFPSISLIELLIFSNAISAVDPVTVLAIFQELKVNESLYYLVFGESLLNDAVVIVMHSLLDGFLRAPIITAHDLIMGMNSFFLTSFGGFMIGVFFGLGTALITLYTVKNAVVVEPMIIIGMAYSSFLTADLFKCSGIISIVGCGLIQYEFASHNISTKTKVTVKYFIKTLSSLSDMLIFFFLGQMLINEKQKWNTPFIIATLLFCIIYRIFSVFTLTYISNNYFHRTRFTNLEEQVLLAYGGLRGAVAFAMIALLEDNKSIENLQLFKTTTFVLILFTGSTTRPLLNLLRIQRASVEPKKFCFIFNDKIVNTVIDVIESIIGNPSAMSNFKHKLQDWSQWLKKHVCRDGGKESSREKPIKENNEDKKSSSEVSEKKRVITPDNLQASIRSLAKTMSEGRQLYSNVVSHKPIPNSIKCTEVYRKFTIGKEQKSRMTRAHDKRMADKTKIKTKANKTKKVNNEAELSKRFKNPYVISIDSKAKSEDKSHKVGRRQSNPTNTSTKH